MKKLKQEYGEIVHKTNYLQQGSFIFISALAHELTFENGVVLNANLDIAKLLVSKPLEIVERSESGITFVKSKFTKTEENVKALEHIIDAFYTVFDTTNIFFVSSIIATQTDWGMIQVVSPIVTKETLRSPPSDKICVWNKWNI